MENINVALTVLVTGFVVVFAVLILLIFIIKIYGTIVYNAQQTSKRKKEEKLKAMKADKPKEEQSVTITEKPAASVAEQGISPRVVAAISAAVYTLYGEKNCRIKAIKKAPQERPVWSTAGIMDNTHPFGL